MPTYRRASPTGRLGRVPPELVEVSFPAGPLHPERILATEGISDEAPQGQVHGRSFRGQSVPSHRFGDQRLVELDVGPTHDTNETP